MKVRTIFTVVLFLFSFAALSGAEEMQMADIKCAITPIHRSKIHPSKEHRLSKSTKHKKPHSTSKYWSGYVASEDFSGRYSKGSVTYVAGCWVVPSLTDVIDTPHCTVWVGMDGYMNNTIEQIGTTHILKDGCQENYAWFEMYPKGAYLIKGFPVDCGDVISVRVGYKGNDTFKMVMFNHTKGVSTEVPSQYTMSARALRSSAEWVVEAPYEGRALPSCELTLLTLNYCSAVINGVSGTIGEWMNEKVAYESRCGLEVLPTSLLKEGSCFQVIWDSE